MKSLAMWMSGSIATWAVVYAVQGEYLCAFCLAGAALALALTPARAEKA